MNFIINMYNVAVIIMIIIIDPKIETATSTLF